MQDPEPPQVRPYLRRLLSAMLLGVIIMASTAIWAWNKYGKKLQDAPPLPEGVPPMSSEPVTPH